MCELNVYQGACGVVHWDVTMQTDIVTYVMGSATLHFDREFTVT